MVGVLLHEFSLAQEFLLAKLYKTIVLNEVKKSSISLL